MRECTLNTLPARYYLVQRTSKVTKLVVSLHFNRQKSRQLRKKQYSVHIHRRQQPNTGAQTHLFQPKSWIPCWWSFDIDVFQAGCARSRRPGPNTADEHRSRRQWAAVEREGARITTTTSRSLLQRDLPVLVFQLGLPTELNLEVFESFSKVHCRLSLGG